MQSKKKKRDTNYYSRRCTRRQEEVAHFITSSIITSCWHPDCWHQLSITVRLLSPDVVLFPANSTPDLAWQVSVRSIMKQERSLCIKELERQLTDSFNALVPVSINLSPTLNIVHYKMCSSEGSRAQTQRRGAHLTL